MDVVMIVMNDVRRDPRVQKEARALARAGYSVGVVGVGTGEDKGFELEEGGYHVRRVDLYSTLRRRALATRPGQLAKTAYRRARGLGRRLKTAVVAAGIKNGAPPVPSHLEGQLSWMREMIHKHPAHMRTLAAAAIQARPKIVHAHDLDTLHAAAWAARATGAALVFDSHEIWWQQHAEGEAPPEWVEFYRRLEAKLIGRADAVITVCESIADFFASTHGITKPLVVRNSIEAPPGGFIAERDLHPTHVPAEVLFHGGYARNRGLEELLSAARLFENARLVLRGFGNIEKDLRAQVEREHLGDKVRFDPPVPMSDVVRAASTADIGVIPYKPVCLNNRYSTPNKLFEYLNAGVAVAASDLPEIRRIVEGERAGMLFDPYRPESIAEAINRLASDPAALTEMRHRALVSAKERHTWEVDAEKLLALYRTLLPRPLEKRLRKIALGS